MKDLEKLIKIAKDANELGTISNYYKGKEAVKLFTDTFTPELVLELLQSGVNPHYAPDDGQLTEQEVGSIRKAANEKGVSGSNFNKSLL